MLLSPNLHTSVRRSRHSWAVQEADSGAAAVAVLLVLPDAEPLSSRHLKVMSTGKVCKRSAAATIKVDPAAAGSRMVVLRQDPRGATAPVTDRPATDPQLAVRPLDRQRTDPDQAVA